MASLLRSPKFFRVLPALVRAIQGPCSVVEPLKRRQVLQSLPNLLSENVRSVSGSSFLPQNWQTHPHAGQPFKTDNEFRTVLRRLDDMVRRTGRITKNQLMVVFDEVSKVGVASPNQALLLIRSCGSLLPEVSSTDRTELAHSIWDKLASMGTSYDVSHYNALLKVYLQNEHKFSPTEFLANMEAKSVEPNRVTYQRLISAYCLAGDIPGATKILEFMKAKELPVTEGVFNSLITGHARAGDMENARHILDVMRNVGLEPSQDTYSTLMCALAEKGDIEGIEEVIKEAESQFGNLADRYYLSVVYSLGATGHQQHIPKILEKVKGGVGFIPDSINLCLSLITRGQIDAAFSLLKMFPLRQETNLDGEPQNQGNFFIDTLVAMGTPHETLFKYLDAMISEGLHNSPYIIALHVALRGQGGLISRDYILELMKKMIDVGVTVRPHYFWPMMASEVNKGNNEGVLQIAKSMLDIGVHINMETYSRYLIPALGDETQVIMDRLKDLGVTFDKQLVAALCRYEVSKNRLANVVQLVKSYPNLAGIAFFRTGLVNSFHRMPQVDPMVSLLNYLWTNFNDSENVGITRQDYIGGVLYDLVRAIPEERAGSLKPHLQLLFDSLADQGIRIALSRFRGIRSVLDQIKLSVVKPNAYKLLDSDEVKTDLLGNLDLLSNADIPVEDLEARLEELKGAGSNFKGVLRRLILYHTANNNYERSMELVEEFNAQGFETTGAIYASLISVCCNHQKFEEAFAFKKKLVQEEPYFKLDMSKYRPLICVLAKQNRMEEALALVQEMKDHDIGTTRQEKQLFHLLNELAQDGLIEETQTIFEKLVELDLVKVNSNILGPVVEAYLVKNDMNGALQCVQDCQTKYGFMPHFHDILVKLVEEGDTEQLQKAMDFVGQQHGDVNMLYDLIFAFLSTGKYKEAKKIFETPGMVARDRRLVWYSEHCLGRNLTEALENLVAMTKDLYGCDRDNLHFYLLQLYTRQKDPDKCLQVWTSMQDEGVVPKDRTLRYLANVLQSFDRPVPFEVPQITMEEMNEGASPMFEEPVPDYQDRITTAAKAGNLTKAMELLEDARSHGLEIRISVYEVLMLEQLKHKNYDEFTRIKNMCENVEGFTLSRNIQNKLIMDYVNGDDAEAGHRMYDEQLETGVIPLRSGIRILATHYEDNGNVDRLLDMKRKYEEKAAESFPLCKCILRAYAHRGNIPEAIEFIEQELDQDATRIRRIGLRSLFVKLLQQGHDMSEVVSMVDRLHNKEIDGAVWQLLFAYLDSNRMDEAKAVSEKYPVVKEKSSRLIGYIISLIGRDQDIVSKITSVLEMAEGEDYLDKETVYFYLFKAYEHSNNWEDALKLREKMMAEDIPITDFNLKRLAMLLQRNGQPVPFDEPPNSLSHYRDQARLDHKDNLAEIEDFSSEAEESRHVHNSTE